MSKIYGNFVGGRAAIGLLIVRLVFGLGIMMHGGHKIVHPFNWMGENAPVPAILQALAALSEFGGGLALILGLLTPLAMLGLASTMFVAIATVHLPSGHPFVGQPGSPSFEPAALYLAVALMSIITGPGSLSLDAIIFGDKTRTSKPNSNLSPNESLQSA
ncbi:MAG: hypothetical protein FD167_649 [bacterium]|nr:MAG: hypothetical protein FD167_649 [bacterium]